MAKVEALCFSEKKGEPKQPIEAAEFRRDYGIVGDAHAGPWHRQVSLLAAEDVDAARAKLPDLRPGVFAENVLLRGVDLRELGLGSRLRLGGEVILTVTQIGKVCHTPCRIGQTLGDCIMPRRGLFARVEAGGRVATGDAVELFEIVSPQLKQAVVLTISDRCWRGEAQDTAGPAAARRVSEGGVARVYRVEVIPDERDQIAARLKHYCDGHSIDLVLTVGGTGFSPRDVTPEATREVIERLTPGLDEAMRAASMARTPHAMLSRGVSGIRGSTLIVNLPGSQRAAVENLDVILPALAHGLAKLGGDPIDCGRAAL
jgi:molybdenum cofactor synthesis domain-containing protein